MRGRVPVGVVVRQARADAWPLLLCLAVVTLTSVGTVLTPRYLASLTVEEVRASVIADPGTAVTVTMPLDDTREARELDAATAQDLVRSTALVGSAFPEAVRAVLAPPVGLLVSPELDAGAVDGAARLVRLALVVDGVPEPGPDGSVADVTAPASGAVTWVAGGRPGLPDGAATVGVPDGTADEVLPVEAAFSEAGAAALDVRPGDRLELDASDGTPVEVVVSGVFRPVDAQAPVWRSVATSVTPRTVGGSAARLEVTALVSDESAAAARLAVPVGQLTRSATFDVRPATLDEHAGAVARAVAGLVAAPGSLGVPAARVTTHLDTVLDDALARVDAGTAQVSLVLTGVVSGALAVLLLATAAVVRRRSHVLRHHREHGATLPTVATSVAPEAALLAVVGGAAGLALADRVLAGPVPWPWLVPPLALTLLAGPLLGGAVAASTAGRPAPSRGGARRVVLELALVLLAAAALVALRQRGAAAAAGRIGSDLVVVAAPVLLAAVVAAVLLRVLPTVAAAVRSLLAGARGPVGLLAAARASTGVLGVLALVVTTASAGLALTVQATVDAAQVAGATSAVGGDAVVVARADPGVPPEVSALAGAPGVTLAEARIVDGVQVIGEGVDERTRLVVVDVAQFRSYLTAAGLPGAAALDGLEGRADAAAVPALTRGLPDAVGTLTVRWLRQSVVVTPVGDAPAIPAIPGAPSDAPLVLVPREPVTAVVGDVTSTVAWLSGPRAGTAVAALGDTGAVVTTRDGWLEAVRRAPVAAGFRLVHASAAVLLVLLAALGVVLELTGGAARRARALAGMRVLGVSRRTGLQTLLAEAVLPVVTVAAVGTATGVGIGAVVVGPLGLGSLAGGGRADLVVPGSVLVPAVVVGAAAVVTVAVEAALHQRVRLGQVMRAG